MRNRTLLAYMFQASHQALSKALQIEHKFHQMLDRGLGVLEVVEELVGLEVAEALEGLVELGEPVERGVEAALVAM